MNANPDATMNMMNACLSLTHVRQYLGNIAPQDLCPRSRKFVMHEIMLVLRMLADYEEAGPDKACSDCLVCRVKQMK